MDSRIGYDDDFYAWTQEQARLLREAARERLNTPIDWDHVAGEIEDMGRSETRAVESALTRILEHLLKLEHSSATDPRNGWKASVVEHRGRVLRDLKASPSLHGKIDLPDVYETARELAALGLAQDGLTLHDLPAECPWSLELITEKGWWPVNRHGLD
ncbi:DUF29 domain-containing protein [Azospirillum canadense]|uniref:DUF29 domain-containing protein n=1 Tax=Azospirillum canadense TaxID=403962 RepID=UPI002226CC95|nr:DUF29 domain-containing protein [Azospirillum canadense]MCW2237313.1 hypothetical protein [Azospirillum canadense]